MSESEYLGSMNVISSLFLKQMPTNEEMLFAVAAINTFLSKLEYMGPDNENMTPGEIVAHDEDSACSLSIEDHWSAVEQVVVAFNDPDNIDWEPLQKDSLRKIEETNRGQ